MLDPFSVALGIVQVADAGFKLANTIYLYGSQIRKAERQLLPIANYVKLTSTVLQQVASLLQDEELKELYKPALLEATKDALDSCEDAFSRLETYVQALVGNSHDGNRSAVPTKTKLVWPWKQKEIEGYQVHLERCKSSFDLLLSTLIFVSSSRSVVPCVRIVTKVALKPIVGPQRIHLA